MSQVWSHSVGSGGGCTFPSLQEQVTPCQLSLSIPSLSHPQIRCGGSVLLHCQSQFPPPCQDHVVPRNQALLPPSTCHPGGLPAGPALCRPGSCQQGQEALGQVGVLWPEERKGHRGRAHHPGSLRESYGALPLSPCLEEAHVRASCVPIHPSIHPSIHTYMQQSSCFFCLSLHLFILLPCKMLGIS